MIQKVKDLVLKIARKLRVESYIRRLWAIFKMHVFERIRINTYDPARGGYITYLFGHRLHLRSDDFSATNGKKIFYFKVNRYAEYTLMCIQHWINIILNFDADFYFVCDNKYLERDILRFIRFGSADVKFMRSWRRKLRKISKCLWTVPWENATYAHLTPFYHAKEHGITKYWTIDADDTLFTLYPPRVAEILQNAENIANEKNLCAFSLDMWRSRVYARDQGRHWSLGILYISDTINFCHYFEETHDFSWTKNLAEVVYNLDCFFNYLKDDRKLAIETFYVENAFFFHWGFLLQQVIRCSICHWKNGRLIFPILKDIYHNDRLGDIPIADCIKIDIGVTEEECLDFMNREIADTADF